LPSKLGFRPPAQLDLSGSFLRFEPINFGPDRAKQLFSRTQLVSDGGAFRLQLANEPRLLCPCRRYLSRLLLRPHGKPF